MGEGTVQIILAGIAFAGGIWTIIKGMQKHTDKLLDGILNKMIDILTRTAVSNEKVSSSSEKVSSAVDRLNGKLERVQPCPFNDEIIKAITDKMKGDGHG